MSDPWSESTTAWLSTTASQIFFMQLGFLCYEVGFVKPVWTQSIILKNIEDTFTAISIFILFGYTLSESPHSFYGIISVPTNPFLYGVEEEHHDRILISAFFASTCATIISGAVLERMKNKAYIIWCLLIVLVNYSFVSHWVWHKDGWLNRMGFIDGAGAVVVHSTAGIASLVAVWRLGPRNATTANKKGRLSPVETAARPIINVIGAFFLWFGWFAFNVSSPIAYARDIGAAVGTTALVTVISPICASCGAFLWMYLGFVKLTYDDLIACLLAGLVAITATCQNCGIWSSAIIGFASSIVYYCTAYIVRYKWCFDDPLQVIAVHYFCGVMSGIAEGIVANDVYGDVGLIYGGYKHFGVQLLGVCVISAFNFIMCVFLYDVILSLCLFRQTDLRVSILDVYLGTRLFDQDYEMALKEVLKCNSNVSRRMLFQFHQYVTLRFASEPLDFLIVVQVINNFIHNNDDKDMIIAKYVVHIINTYVEENSARCINVSGTHRGILLKIKQQILLFIHPENEDTDGGKQASVNIGNKPQFTPEMLREDLFKATHDSVRKIVVTLFVDFLQNACKVHQKRKKKFDVKIPFKLTTDWVLDWDETLIKETKAMDLVDAVPQPTDHRALLRKSNKVTTNDSDKRSSEIRQQIQLSDIQQSEYTVIFKDKQGVGDTTIIIE